MIEFATGSSEFIRSTAGLVPATTGSLTFWMFINSMGSNADIFSSDTTGHRVRLLSDGTLQSRMLRRFNDTADSVTLLSAGVRYHIGLTWENGVPSAGNTRNNIYIDGVIDLANDDGNDDLPSTNPLTLASHTDGGSNFDGLLEDIRYYNRILTPGEFSTIHTASAIDNIINGLEHRFIMNEGPSGTVVGASAVKDYAGNLVMTTVNGTPTFEGTQLKLRRHI